jgi:hypothetical protein
MYSLVLIAATTDQIFESPAMLHQVKGVLAEPSHDEDQNGRSCGMLTGEAHRKVR